MFLRGTGTVRSSGTNSGAVFVETVNGNGGNGGAAGNNFRFGAGGGAGGAGGRIDVGNVGDWTIVNTGLSNAHGVYIKSIGGRGGNPGLAQALCCAGGVGGSGGKAADILFQSVPQGNVSITTQGAGSHGLFLAQQNGDGGPGGASYGLGADGRAGGAGGAGGQTRARAESDWTIVTTGVGIYLDSIGGNGGAGGRG